MTTFDADVIVVGAGPVGLVTALLLADRGVRTTLVEKQTDPGDLPRAISLQDESFRTFAQLGVADALKETSLLDTGSRYFGRRDRLLLEAKPTPSRLGHPAKTQFDQPDLERLLWERAVQSDRIQFLTGAEVVALAQDAEQVAIEVDTETASRSLRARWLVGADGGRSRVRGELGIDLVGTTQPQRWIVIDLSGETRHRDPYAEFHGDGMRPYVLVPGAHGRLRIEFMMFPNEDPDEMTAPERIRELVVPAVRDRLDEHDVRRAVVYVAHQRIARTYRQGRAFLVGDAAHLMPPFAGQGLNAGVRDAAALVWRLAEAISGGASQRLLDTYEAERRPHGAKMILISRRVGRVVMATNPIAVRARDAVARAAARVPRIRDYLAYMRFITPPDYGPGLTLDASGALDGVLPGRALPQPSVASATSDRVGLDEHLGNSWALLQVGGARDELAARDAYWSRIGARRLRILAPGNRPEGGAVAEIRPILTAAEPADATFIAVRPDRYVAAVFSARDEERIVRELRAFIDDRVRETTIGEVEA